MAAVGVGPGLGPAPEEEVPRTRCGYTPAECIRAFEKSLPRSGAAEAGRAIHFAADMICSGAMESFLRVLWSYAIQNIGIASPRIFVYLKRRCKELQDMFARAADEDVYASEEFQIRVGELILIVRECPTRPAVSWPRVGAETHEPGWVTRGEVTETAALLRVWKGGGDTPILRTVGAHLLKAVGDGATAKALFWIKWLYEEETRIRKETPGATLTTVDRGGAGTSAKARHDVGHFILALYAETYKELAVKQLIRMNEEFQTLLDLWRSGDKVVAGGVKRQILAVLTQILCEVPRWKVPAAPQLVQDPVRITRAIKEMRKFFQEVLVYDGPRGKGLAKLFKSRGKADPKVAAAAKKGAAAAAQLEAFDAAMDAYFARM